MNGPEAGRPAAVPAAFVLTKLPLMTVPEPEDARITISVEPLPAMMLRSPAAAPPMMVEAAALAIPMP